LQITFLSTWEEKEEADQITGVVEEAVATTKADQTDQEKETPPLPRREN